jgi:hypothetical protein
MIRIQEVTGNITRVSGFLFQGEGTEIKPEKIKAKILVGLFWWSF